jgi:hypothetical protein
MTMANWWRNWWEREGGRGGGERENGWHEQLPREMKVDFGLCGWR